MTFETTKTERVPLDNYPTPRWPVMRFLERYGHELLELSLSSSKPRPALMMLEPCAGSGNMIRHFEAWATETKFEAKLYPSSWFADPLKVDVKLPERRWCAVELDSQHEGALVRLQLWRTLCPKDFLRLKFKPGQFALNLSNPPYAMAQEFIEFGLACSHVVAYLLRLNYLESEARANWLRSNMPRYIGVLPQRPAFRQSSPTTKAKTDRTAYAWMVWRAGDRLRSCPKIEVLDSTPISERRSSERAPLPARL